MGVTYYLHKRFNSKKKLTFKTSVSIFLTDFSKSHFLLITALNNPPRGYSSNESLQQNTNLIEGDEHV